MKLLAKAAVLLFVFGLISCRSNELTEYGVPVSETLFYNLMQEPPTIDWNKVEDATSRVVVDNIMETLVSYDYSEPGAPLIEGLAKSWTSEENGKVWTFKFREAVKWTDGVEFTGQQVVDSFERVLNPKTGALGSDDFYIIKGAKAYNRGQLKDFSKVGIKLVSKHTVKFELDKPISFFPYVLSLPQVAPIRADLIKKHGDAWTKPENLVTLGAYKLKRWNHDEYILLEANPNYFGKKAHIKNVILRMVREDNTAVNLFETGRLDVQMSLPSNDLSRIRKMKEYVSFNNSCVAFLVFNTKLPPMDNINVRKAISYAIDREPVLQVLGGGRKLNKGWLPEGLMGYDPQIGLDFDPSKAKAYLKKAGYKKPSDVPPIKLVYNTNSNYKTMFELIQAQLKKNLGLRVELENLEWKAYLNRIRSNMPHIHRMGWIGVYPDPDVMMRPLTGGVAAINQSWTNERFNKIVYKAMSEFSPKKREDLYRKASKILVEEEVPVFNIYTCAQQYLISDRLAFYPLNKEARDIFKFARFK